MNHSVPPPPDIAPDLSVVIVNWNTRDLVAQCLESLGIRPDGALPALANWDPAQLPTHMTIEVKVVDNGSTDSSVEMIKARFPLVHLLENQENVGFARANNQAIRECKGRYVLLLNPDTKLRPGALKNLVNFISAYPHAAAVAPRLLNPDGTLQPSCHPAPTLFGELWQLFHLDAFWPHGVYTMRNWDVENPREVDVVQGACVLLRRSALDQVGLLDEDYFMYSEEVDLCLRLRRVGWSLYWVPKAEVIHYGGQSTRQVAAKMFLQLYRSKVHYFRKHHGWLTAQAFKLILTCATLVRLSLSPIAWLGRFPQRERHLTLAVQYLRLLRALPQY